MPRLGLSNTPYTPASFGLGTGITSPSTRQSQPQLMGPPNPYEPTRTPGGGVTDTPMSEARLRAIRRNIGRMAIAKARSRKKNAADYGMVTTDDLHQAQEELRSRGLSFDQNLGYEPFQTAAGTAIPIRDFTRSFIRGVPISPPTVYRPNGSGQFVPGPAY